MTSSGDRPLIWKDMYNVFFSFSGRVSRGEYILVGLVLNFLFRFVNVIINPLSGGDVTNVIMALIEFYFSFGLIAGRFRDAGLGINIAFCYVVLFISALLLNDFYPEQKIIAVFVYFMLFFPIFIPRQKRDNLYGPYRHIGLVNKRLW